MSSKVVRAFGAGIVWVGMGALVAACSLQEEQVEDNSSQHLSEDLSEFAVGQVILKFNDSEKRVPEVGVSMNVAGLDLNPVIQLPSGAWLMKVETSKRLNERALAQKTVSAVASLKSEPSVRYAQLDHVVRLSASPRDPLFPFQWHFQDIGLPAAWDRTMGSSSVKIAAIDTGEVDHPDVDAGLGEGQDFYSCRKNSCTPDSYPTDDGPWHHGTHVMGLLGGRSNGIGGIGVCPDCTIVPVRAFILDGYASSVERGLDWAVNVAGVDVVNMSFNGDPGRGCDTFPSAAETISNVKDTVVLVASANNHRGPVTFPADCDGVLGVAASTPSSTLAAYSGRGPGVDLVAPGGGLTNGDGDYGFFGDGIDCPPDLDPFNGFFPPPYNGTLGVVSSWAIYKPANNLEPGDKCYRYLSGTSMASPHVAGVAGLMLSVNPSLTATQVRQLLKSTARPNAISCPRSSDCGAGFLDAAAAVAAAASTGPQNITPAVGGWWNPSRSGNGIDFRRTPTGDYVAIWYTYTSNGTPTWYITDPAPLNGSQWTAPLRESSWDYATESNTLTQVGQLSLSLTNETHGTFSWRLGNSRGAEPFRSLLFGGTTVVGPASGMWYPPSESGWGSSVWQRGITVVMTVFAYDSIGRPTWVQGVSTGAVSNMWFETMNQFVGTSLCPGCTGDTPAQPSDVGHAWLRLEANTGNLAVNFDYSATFGSWIRDVPIARLTN